MTRNLLALACALVVAATTACSDPTGGGFLLLDGKVDDAVKDSEDASDDVVEDVDVVSVFPDASTRDGDVVDARDARDAPDVADARDATLDVTDALDDVPDSTDALDDAADAPDAPDVAGDAAFDAPDGDASGGTCSATPISGGPRRSAATGSTAGGGSRTGGSCGGSTSPEVAFTWTAPAAGDYTFDTEGSAFDTVLYARDGGCAGRELGCNDDASGLGLSSRVTVRLAEGQTVALFVDGYGGDSGRFVLNISTSTDGGVVIDVPTGGDGGMDASDAAPDVIRDASVGDLAPDVADVPVGDGGPRACTTAADCNDGIACTLDACRGGVCAWAPDNYACPSTENCVPLRGCVAAPPCTSSSTCVDTACLTDGYCSTLARGCRYYARDDDYDDYPSLACGGGDCDDHNSRVYPGATEACDGVDNDCDGAIDEGAATSLCPGGSCVGGRCVCASSGLLLCGGRCVDVMTDASNCGRCGTYCPSGSSCVGGVCACSAGRTACSGRCVDLQTDYSNCGACGTYCDFSASCVAGACRCTTGLSLCTGRCVDLQTSPSNCGACGTTCRSDQVCRAGACACPTGSLSCGGRCVDVTRDASNCGACGAVCPAAGFGGACLSGRCGCSAGVLCGDGASARCVDVTRDAANCGACGMACTGARECVSGRCVCPSTLTTVCGARCVDTAIDPANCGACGRACAAPAAGTVGVCTAGVCGVTCAPGRADCDSNMSNGCETDISTSTNCGACGRTCASPASCMSGVCFTCGTATSPRVLIYGPGGTDARTYFPAGAVVTTATEASWRSLTTANFGEYDLIWVDGSACSGTAAQFDALRDTQAAWGPAVRGRLVITSFDEDFHAVYSGSGSSSARMITNAVNYLAAMGHNSAGGRTGMYLSFGCVLETTPSIAANYAGTFGAGLAGVTGYTTPTLTTAGTAHPIFAGATSYASTYCHGSLTAPAGFTTLMNCGGTSPGMILRHVDCP